MDEQALIEQAKTGDQAAYEQLVERYQKSVYHQALRLVNHPEDAADVTQEVFWKVWKNLPAFRGDSSFSTWLYRLTDNAALDLLRREKKHRGEGSLDDDELVPSMPAPESAQPHRLVEQAELRQTVSQALAQLPEMHRRILVLREINGLSYEEIGKILELTPGTVKSRIARARSSLARILKKSGNFLD